MHATVEHVAGWRLRIVRQALLDDQGVVVHEETGAMGGDDERLPAITLERLLRGRIPRLTGILPRGTYRILAERWWRKGALRQRARLLGVMGSERGLVVTGLVVTSPLQ